LIFANIKGVPLPERMYFSKNIALMGGAGGGGGI